MSTCNAGLSGVPFSMWYGMTVVKYFGSSPKNITTKITKKKSISECCLSISSVICSPFGVDVGGGSVVVCDRVQEISSSSTVVLNIFAARTE